MAYRLKPRPGRKQSTDVSHLPHFESSKYEPFSHYVLGGYDLTGEHTALTSNTSFDDDEVVNSLQGTDAMCEPRVSRLDLIESLGIDELEEAAAEETKTDD